MNKEDLIKRFRFIPIVCMAMLLLIIAGRLISAIGAENIDFAQIDSRVIKKKEVELASMDSKNPLMPGTQNEGYGDIDINNATAKELETLPNIGEKKAKDIVKQRSKMGGFTVLRDILCTDGIGAETFENINQHIKISEYLCID